jgi:signal transduction histidine kinase
VRNRDAFDEHQLRILQAIADSISPVVEKAYRIEMLTKANKDYGEVLSFISHELQSPIASMVTDARLLEGGYLGDLNEMQKQKIGRSIRKGTFLLSMIRDFLNLARLEEGSLKADMTQDVDLMEEVVEPVIELVLTEVEAKEIRLRYDVEQSLPAIHCDVGLLRIAVGNLLRNAITYGRKGGEIRVGLSRDKDVEGLLNITVWNEGPGFSETQRSRLFRKFSRLDDPELKKKKGTGIGLYLTWRIMQLHRGRATARSLRGQWAEFTLTLPTPQHPGMRQNHHHERISCAPEPLK